MGDPSITDWMNSIGTVVAALIAAPAAVYAAIHTRRAADAGAEAAAAGAKAATEAANQVKELQILREPRAVLILRVPDQLTGENQIKYGKGNYQYRSGTPVYLDVWNVGGPTIMVMEVGVRVKGIASEEAEFSGFFEGPLTPQLLIESGKVGSINVAYQLMYRISSNAEEPINFLDKTTATAEFTVKYFSGAGERVIKTDCGFYFHVTDDNVFTFVDGSRGFNTLTGGNYFPAQHTKT
jgi:hypothetical protein